MSGYKTLPPRLKVFGINNTPKTVIKGQAFLHVSASGVFTINKPMVAKLGLKEGDKVQLAQDEVHTKDWYLLPNGSAQDGFTLRKKTGDTLMFNSAGLADMIFKSVGSKAKSGRILLGSEQEEHGELKVWPLITVTLSKEEKK